MAVSGVSAGTPVLAAAARGALVALVAVAFALAAPTLASAAPMTEGPTVEAPGLTAGPVITGAGLAWESARGILLTGRAGVTTVLAPPDEPNWDGVVGLAWFGRKWWALAQPSGVLAGRIGGKLAALPTLRRCNPATRSSSSAADGAEYVVAGEHLFAAEPRGCFTRRRTPAGRIVEVDLRTRRSRVLASIPGSVSQIAATGRYVAVAYRRETSRAPAHTGPPAAEPRLLVRVLDTATGALIDEIAPPPHAEQFERVGATGLQVDEHGDVLVTAGCCAGSPGGLAHVARPLQRTGWWWARAGSRVGREVSLGSDPSLSDGRVAFYATNASGTGPAIDVENLLDGRSRTVVTFAGSAGSESLALDGESLAWAQQSTVINVTQPVRASSCTIVPLGPVELGALNLRSIAAPVVVTGAPIPPQYANEPPCFEP